MNVPPPDPDSLRYSRYWEPVLAGPAARLLERIEADPADYQAAALLPQLLTQLAGSSHRMGAPEGVHS